MRININFTTKATNVARGGQKQLKDDREEEMTGNKDRRDSEANGNVECQVKGQVKRNLRNWQRQS